MTLLSALAPNDFPNGAVMFCSHEVSEVMHPVQPLLHRSLLCGERFDVSAVKEALKVIRELTYGVVVVDGDEATLGTMQVSVEGSSRGAKVFQLAHLSTNIASRTRRGGSSAMRYSRNRDAEELAFLRKVVAVMNESLGGVRGILIGGRADMKHKLKAELTISMRDRVARVVDLPCHANPDGLQKMASHIQEVAVSDQELEGEAAVVRFMELIAQTDTHEAPLVCYGELETKAALHLGAVQTLLVSVTPTESSCKNKDFWGELASASSASLVEVHPKGCMATNFCKGFGIGACLRYSLDRALLESDTSNLASSSKAQNASAQNEMGADTATSAKPLPFAQDSDNESITTAPSEADTLLHKWLADVLSASLSDTVAANCLAIGTELVLFDETLPVEERLENASEMLRGEGVSEDVLNELAFHVNDHFGMDLQ